MPAPFTAASGGDAKRRIIDLLKRVDTSSVSDLAGDLGVTGAAVRQHLDQLEAQGLVSRREPEATGARGRPAQGWRLTPLAAELFPDRHADLTVDLIESIRSALGQDGLDAVINARSERVMAGYREVLTGLPVRRRVDALARLRSAEGYLADVVDDGASLTLIEHHCPICDAAAVCQGLCRDELTTFERLFDDVATVERVAHLLSGDQRCAYRITPRRTS